MSKYDDFKQELNALYEKGLKLFEAIQTQSDEADKKYSYFRANYEIWYSKSFILLSLCTLSINSLLGEFKQMIP